MNLPNSNTVAFIDSWTTVYQGDCSDLISKLPDSSIDCCVTSPPYYGLRDYGHENQIGVESSPYGYIENLVTVFLNVHRVLKDEGTLWLNLGDSYAGSGKGVWDKKDGGHKEVYIPDTKSAQSKIPKVPAGLKPKDLMGIPWRVAIALQQSGWYLRSDIIWHKPNAMPESVTDRPTKSHEYIFLLSKSENYYYDNEAIKEPAICGWNDSLLTPSDLDLKVHPNAGTKPRPSAPKDSFNGKTEAMADSGQNAFRAVVEKRNKRSVWSVPTAAFKDSHFATFPPDLIKPCILAGCPKDGVVLDPFAGSGTTGLVAKELGRKSVLIELNPDYIKFILQRTNITPPLFT